MTITVCLRHPPVVSSTSFSSTRDSGSRARFALRFRSSAIGFVVLVAALVAGADSPHGIARADEFVSRLNAPYAALANDKRSDLILLPVLARMAEPPIGVATLAQARLLPGSSADFAVAAAWAKAEGQQAVLKAIAEVTKEREWRKATAFGLPYGVDSTPQDIVRSGLYTDLGDPPSLAGADHRFLPRLDMAGILVNIEATRLASEGKPSDAIDVLLNWAAVCRQMVDRAFFAEAAWGLTNMIPTFERVRDIAYQDTRGGKVMDIKRLYEQIQRMLPGALLDVDRLRIPNGDATAAEQLVSRVYSGRSGPDEAVFGSTMARLGAGKFPLRLMSESAKWRSAASSQGTIYEVKDTSEAIFADWDTRWSLGFFDRKQGTPTEYSKLDRVRYSVIDRAVPDYGRLLDLRQAVLLERIGTSHALSLVGFAYTAKSFPPDASSVRPRWLRTIEDDPFSRDLLTQNSFPLRYFVPIRDDAQNSREEAKPHEMSVVPTSGDPFSVRLREDTMVVYSVGTDQANNRARQVQNTSSLVQGADYLIWPPMLYLQRQNLMDRGDLK